MITEKWEITSKSVSLYVWIEYGHFHLAKPFKIMHPDHLKKFVMSTFYKVYN